VLDLVAAADAQRAERARRGLPPPPRIGVYPETKHPSYFASSGCTSTTDARSAERHGYSKRTDPICLQSFEVANLKALRRRTDLPLVQLVGARASPSISRWRRPRSYLDLMTDAGLAEIATYADAIGRTSGWSCSSARTGADTGLARARARGGLGIHVWTLRAENEFLPGRL
jgi:glycerophosphoryl diester phosphodiesterase